MWFRNLQLYPLVQPFTHTASELEQMLAKHPFAPCGALDMKTQGFTPVANTESLVYAQRGQLLITLRIEEKKLPGEVVKRKTDERAAEIAAKQGFPVGHKEMRGLHDEVVTELLPKQFGRQRTTSAWIDPANGWLVVDAPSPSKAEEMLEMLHKAVEGLTVSRPKTVVSPRSAMTNWLLADEAPSGFTIDRDGELMSPTEDKATVKFVRHTLDAAHIRQHIEEGKLATKLALTWNDRISFVLTEDFQVKRVAFLDILKDEAEKAESVEEQFAADFTLMTGELARFIPALIEALGGEMKDE